MARDEFDRDYERVVGCSFDEMFRIYLERIIRPRAYNYYDVCNNSVWCRGIKLTLQFSLHHEAIRKQYILSEFRGFFCPLDHGTNFNNHIPWKGGNHGA